MLVGQITAAGLIQLRLVAEICRPLLNQYSRHLSSIWTWLYSWAQLLAQLLPKSSSRLFRQKRVISWQFSFHDNQIITTRLRVLDDDIHAQLINLGEDIILNCLLQQRTLCDSSRLSSIIAHVLSWWILIKSAWLLISWLRQSWVVVIGFHRWHSNRHWRSVDLLYACLIAISWLKGGASQRMMRPGWRQGKVLLVLETGSKWI